MRIIALGSGGWIPTSNNETTSFLVELKEKLILFDAGTGISNLRNYSEIINKYNEVSIILSHYHLDHIIGLTYLIAFFKKHKLKFYGPGKPFYQEGVKNILSKFLDPIFFSRPLTSFSDEVEFYDYDENGFFIDDIVIDVNLQSHSIESFGINIDHKLHFATDTSVINETYEKSRSASLLFHECWEIEKVGNSKHSSLEEIILMSEKYPQCRIGLIHKNPFWGESDYMKIWKRIEDKNIFVVEDGMDFYLD